MAKKWGLQLTDEDRELLITLKEDFKKLHGITPDLSKITRKLWKEESVRMKRILAASLPTDD